MKAFVIDLSYSHYILHEFYIILLLWTSKTSLHQVWELSFIIPNLLLFRIELAIITCSIETLIQILPRYDIPSFITHYRLNMWDIILWFSDNTWFWINQLLLMIYIIAINYKNSFLPRFFLSGLKNVIFFVSESTLCTEQEIVLIYRYVHLSVYLIIDIFAISSSKLVQYFLVVWLAYHFWFSHDGELIDIVCLCFWFLVFECKVHQVVLYFLDTLSFKLCLLTIKLV